MSALTLAAWIVLAPPVALMWLVSRRWRTRRRRSFRAGVLSGALWYLVHREERVERRVAARRFTW
jgi:hypothetical protein